MARVKATDLIDYTRASNGTALAKVSYGHELVTNGTFDSDLTAWTDASTGSESASVSSGQLVLNRVDSSNSAKVYQAITTNAGGVYAITLDISDAGLYVRAGTGTSGSSAYNLLNENGVGNALNFQFVATGSTTYITIGPATANGVTGKADNISVKEVTFDQPDGTLQLFNHPTNIPRIEYDADGNLLGLLIEESRTNLIPYSEDFSVGVTTREDAGEFQGMSRKLFTKTTTSATAYTYNFTASAGDHTLTLVMEQGTNRFTSFGLIAGGWLGLARIDWDSMIIQTAAGTLQSSSVEILGTGPSGKPVARLTATINVPSAGAVQFYNYLFNSAPTAENLTVYFYHQQLEAGSFPTSYIPTSGATATRAADVASIPVSDFGYNQGEGTVVVEASQFDTDTGASQSVYLGDNTTDYVSIYTQYGVYYRVGSEGGNSSSGNIVLNTGGSLSDISKVATSWKNDSSFNAARDGTLGTGFTDFNGLTAIPTNVYFGTRNGSASPLNGHIKSIRYFPRRLTNAKLQELTT